MSAANCGSRLRDRHLWRGVFGLQHNKQFVNVCRALIAQGERRTAGYKATCSGGARPDQPPRSLDVTLEVLMSLARAKVIAALAGGREGAPQLKKGTCRGGPPHLRALAALLASPTRQPPQKLGRRRSANNFASPITTVNEYFCPLTSRCQSTSGSLTRAAARPRRRIAPA